MMIPRSGKRDCPADPAIHERLPIHPLPRHHAFVLRPPHPRLGWLTLFALTACSPTLPPPALGDAPQAAHDTD